MLCIPFRRFSSLFLVSIIFFVHLGSTAYFDIVMSHNAGPVENVNTKLKKIEEKLEKKETELEEAKKGKLPAEEIAKAELGVAKAERDVADAKIEKAELNDDADAKKRAISMWNDAEAEVKRIQNILSSGMFLWSWFFPILISC